MPHNKTSDKGGFLASLLFLKQEAARGGFENTEAAVEAAIETFFEDLERTDQLDQDIISIRNLLVKAMALNEANLMRFIDIIQSLDSEDGGGAWH